MGIDKEVLLLGAIRICNHNDCPSACIPEFISLVRYRLRQAEILLVRKHPEELMVFCIGIAFLYFISILLVVFSNKIVSWHATYSRNSYPDKRSLEQADRLMIFNPLSKFLIGTMSDYAAKGPEHPEAFPRMIWFIRLLGLIPMVVYTLVVIFMIFKE